MLSTVPVHGIRHTKIIINMREKTYEERLKSLGLWTLEERRNRQVIIEVFKMYRGYSSFALQELFQIDTNSKGTMREVTLVNLKRLGAQGPDI